MQIQSSYKVHLNMISNGELSDRLCGSVIRDLTLVRLEPFARAWMRVTGRYSQCDTTRNPAVFYHFHQRTDANYSMTFIILVRILYNFHMKRNLHENYVNIPLYIRIPFTDFGSTWISRSRGIQIKIWRRGWFSMFH